MLLLLLLAAKVHFLFVMTFLQIPADGRDVPHKDIAEGDKRKEAASKDQNHEGNSAKLSLKIKY